MNNTLIDNSSEQLSMLNLLKDCFADERIRTVKIATGYWDIPGLALLADSIRQFLEREGTRILLLIGRDPYIYWNQVRNPKYKDLSFPGDYIRTDISELEPKEEFENAVNLLLDYCSEKESSKIQIRIFRKNEEDDIQFLHSKCYIFDGACVGTGYGFIGSSNFTEKGLRGNAELNYLETDVTKVLSDTPIPNHKTHLQWFNEKWDISEEWNREFLEQVLKKTPIAKKVEETRKTKEALTPYDVYIKYLQQHFGDLANPKSIEVLKSYLPKKYSVLNYQLDAVLQCFYIMRNHGGFILGDVVGLGKTVVGLLIIKKFLDEASTLDRERKVLIVTPPAILPSWQKTLLEFDEEATDKISDCISFITTGSIGKLIDFDSEDLEEDDNEPQNYSQEPEEQSDAFAKELGYDNYGLIIIDESHNFRSSSTQKYNDLDSLIGDILLRTGNAPFVGLLSATPQNNSPEDIRSQIYLFQREPNKSTLPNIEGGKLDSFFSRAINDFYYARKISTSEEGKRLLINSSNEVRKRVLDDLLVRRTRRDIKTHYQEDSKNIHFPTVSGPHTLEYKFDEELCQLFFDTINAIVREDDNSPLIPGVNLGFYRYISISFLVSKQHQKLYEGRNIDVGRVSRQLSNIMRINLIKRLESSFAAFKSSLHNLQQYTQNMIDMLDNNTVYICPDINVNKVIEKEGGLQKAIPVLDKLIEKKKKNNKKFRRADFKDEYRTHLNDDLLLINNLCKRWDKNELDPKMDSFKKHFLVDLFNPTINNPKQIDKPRLVIFTEAIDTLDTLTRFINTTGHRALKISAKNRKDLQQVITENFDANSDVKKDDYDVIVTTEVLAEGVNLHRSNVILNYDTPWNSTRLMQRIGRVNRIGSKEDTVHVFNFYPTTESNQQINLIEISYSKLQAFHTMFGEDNKVFSEREILSEADFNKLIDDEESPFAKYISDLKLYQSKYPDRYNLLIEKPFMGLGGTVVNDSRKRLAVVVAQNRGITNIISDTEDTKVVSPLIFMEELRCGEDARFLQSSINLSESLREILLRCYNSHVTQMINSRDARYVIIEANTFLHDVILPNIKTEEGQRAYGAANIALRRNNISVARKLIKYKQELEQKGVSLFGLESDIDMWVSSAFSSIAEKAQQKYGNPEIALFEEI